jgi:hypothetical protein
VTSSVVSASASPRLRVAPRAAKTYGDLAGDFAGDYGLAPDDWQQVILDDWLRDIKGRWASLTCGLSVPRQNGKNGVLEMRELFGMVGRGEKILHTAHQVKTAQKHFRRLKHFFGKKADDPTAKYPELNALVTEIRNVNGQEAIFLSNGGSVEIVARSQGSGRGFTVDVIVCDEAQDMSDDDQEALLSTSSASPLRNPQWIYTGTPPGPKANGEVFTRIRGEALGGQSKRICWHEWSCEGDVDLDDHAQWRRANPALGGRLLFDVVEGERGNLSDDGFARERLGMWAGSLSTSVIDPESWHTVRDESSKAVDRFALAIDVAPDRAVSSVAFAGQREDGSWHVELDETRNGVGWLVGYIADRCDSNPIRTVVIDGASPANSLVDDLEQRGVNVTTTTAREMAAACGQLYDGVMDAWLHHIDQPQLNLALSVARKRSLGDAWAWNRKTAASDITPIVAATLALWGAQSSSVTQPKQPSTVYAF